MPNRNKGSEHQTEKDDSERCNEEDMAALNTITKKGWRL